MVGLGPDVRCGNNQAASTKSVASHELRLSGTSWSHLVESPPSGREGRVIRSQAHRLMRNSRCRGASPVLVWGRPPAQLPRRLHPPGPMCAARVRTRTGPARGRTGVESADGARQCRPTPRASGPFPDTPAGCSRLAPHGAERADRQPIEARWYP